MISLSLLQKTISVYLLLICDLLLYAPNYLTLVNTLEPFALICQSVNATFENKRYWYYFYFNGINF